MVKYNRYILKFCITFLFFVHLGAEVIVVNSNLDDPALNPIVNPLTAEGVITLRSAMERADANNDLSNTINFDIPGIGPFIIPVGTGIGFVGDALPTIAKSLTINGYSQPNATVARLPDTNAVIALATILIVINGSAVTNGVFQDGLTFLTGSDSSVIEGLVIQDFPRNGIAIEGGNAQRIVGNYIGLNQAGTSAIPNGGNGIIISPGVNGVIIGSRAVADRNIISGQDSITGAMPVSGAGIFTEGSNGQIIGNLIGTDANGTASVPNRTGIYIFNPAPANPLNNTIRCNTIENNNGTEPVEGFGIIINGASDNSVLSNSIFNNAKSAIVFINDGNDNLPAPVLTTGVASGSTIEVNGTLSSPANPNSIFRIEFFISSNNRIPITEGQTFVGQATITTDGSGNGVFNNIRLPSNANPGQFVSATATLLGLTGAIETSPYSPDLTLTQGSTEGSLSVAIYLKYCNRNDLPCASPLA